MDIYNMFYLCWFRPVQYVMKEQFSTGLLYVELIKVIGNQITVSSQLHMDGGNLCLYENITLDL